MKASSDSFNGFDGLVTWPAGNSSRHGGLKHGSTRQAGRFCNACCQAVVFNNTTLYKCRNDFFNKIQENSTAQKENRIVIFY
jgi:hypothetical protein